MDVRACPGQELAENTIWITIVSLFYAFKITPALDDQGNEIPIDNRHSEHSVRYVVHPLFDHLTIFLTRIVVTRNRLRAPSNLVSSLLNH